MAAFKCRGTKFRTTLRRNITRTTASGGGSPVPEPRRRGCRLEMPIYNTTFVFMEVVEHVFSMSQPMVPLHLLSEGGQINVAETLLTAA